MLPGVHGTKPIDPVQLASLYFNVLENHSYQDKSSDRPSTSVYMQAFNTERTIMELDANQ